MPEIPSFGYRPSPIPVIFGPGTLERTPQECHALGLTRPFVLASGSQEKAASRIATLLGTACAGVNGRSEPDTPQRAVDEALHAIARSQADSMIVIGGGTAVGLGKTVAAMTRLPWIAIPTTYSGSEMMPNWYVGAGPDRYGGTSRYALPALAIYDPALTLGLPPRMSAASGMNAMAHAVESLYGPDVSPPVTTLAPEAVGLLGQALPRIVAEPDDIAARSEALYAAWLAAAFRAKTGIEHVLAQRVRQWFGLEHAATHAVMLPYAVALNKHAAPEAVALVGNALGAGDAGLALHQLNVQLGLPTGLKDLGLSRADIDRAAKIVSEGPLVNPGPVTQNDIRLILEQAFEGEPPRF